MSSAEENGRLTWNSEKAAAGRWREVLDAALRRVEHLAPWMSCFFLFHEGHMVFFFFFLFFLKVCVGNSITAFWMVILFSLKKTRDVLIRLCRLFHHHQRSGLIRPSYSYL